MQLALFQGRVSCYHVIDGDNLFDECSDTLMSFLSKLSPNFEKALPAVMSEISSPL